MVMKIRFDLFLFLIKKNDLTTTQNYSCYFDVPSSLREAHEDGNSTARKTGFKSENAVRRRVSNVLSHTIFPPCPIPTIPPGLLLYVSCVRVCSRERQKIEYIRF